MTSSSEKPAGAHVVKKQLADGTIKEYRYERKGAAARVQPAMDDTLGSLILAYKRSPEYARLQPQTKVSYRYLDHLERFKPVQLGAIRRRDIIAIRDALAATSGPGAANKFLSTVKALWAWAVDRDWLEVSPMAAIKALPGGHLPAWTQPQALEAIASLPEQLRRVVILGIYTGQRRSDLCAMTWRAYDGRCVRVKQIKMGENAPELEIPVHPALKAELDAWKASATSTHILTNAHGRPWLPTSLSQLLPDALERIGLPVGLNVHGLRKLSASLLAEAGCTANQIMAVTGHTTLGMVELYTKSAQQPVLAEQAMGKLVELKR